MTRLKKIRKGIGLRQIQLAISSGVNQSMLSLYENDWMVPSQKHALKIASALNRPVDEVFNRVKTS
jgi:transcriptional regulator with XRE-family HTH domain